MINYDEGKYFSLHTHSNMSVYDGMSPIEDLVEQAVAHGHKGIALTDHGQLAGTYHLQQVCKKAGIKPILGMEGYVVDDLVTMDEAGKKRIRTPNGHIILLAKNETGWKNLLKLNYLSNLDEEHYYYRPRFNFKELFENHEGLICSTACLASPIARLLLDGKEKEAEEKFLLYLDNFKEDLYAEVQLNEILNQKVYDDWLIDQANKHGVPIVVTGDVHYAKPEGAVVQKLAFSIRGDGDGQDFAAKSLYYHGISDYLEFNKKFGYNYPEEKIVEWCENTSLVADKVNYLIPERYKMRLPRQAFDEYGTLEKKAKEGLGKHFNCEYKDCPQEYKDRVEKELKLMWKKGIARYILCLADIINWCDNEGHVAHGIGRGSACGSLVLACVGITGWAIDPLKYDLLFERFVSEERLPDCIIDYSKKENGGK